MHASKHINENAGSGDDLAATETPNARAAGKEFIVEDYAAVEMNATATRNRCFADTDPAI
jgi:hypothetical protein